MVRYSDGDEEGVFATGVIPARKAIVHKAAQIALIALAHDLSAPGVHRAVNWQLIRHIASIEAKHHGYTVEHLEYLVRDYRTKGLTDDVVSDRIVEYCEALRAYGE